MSSGTIKSFSLSLEGKDYLRVLSVSGKVSPSVGAKAVQTTVYRYLLSLFRCQDRVYRHKYVELVSGTAV